MGGYGAPPKFFLDIHRMYQYLIAVLKIGNGIEQIVQEVGERQGDNTAPVLLLILMASFDETPEDIWEEKGMEKVEFQRVSDDDFEKG